MSATLTIVYWRDIPAQVIATDGGRTARRQLDGRFMQAIDAAAMRAGLIEADAYLEQWRRVARPCGNDIDAEVDAEVVRLEREFDRALLLRLTRSGGVADVASGSS